MTVIIKGSMLSRPKRVSEMLKHANKWYRYIILTEEELLNQDRLVWERDLKYDDEKIRKLREIFRFNIAIKLLLSRNDKINDVKVRLEVIDIGLKKIVFEYKGLLSRIKDNWKIIENYIEDIKYTEEVKEYMKALLKYIFELN